MTVDRTLLPTVLGQAVSAKDFEVNPLIHFPFYLSHSFSSPPPYLSVLCLSRANFCHEVLLAFSHSYTFALVVSVPRVPVFPFLAIKFSNSLQILTLPGGFLQTILSPVRRHVSLLCVFLCNL